MLFQQQTAVQNNSRMVNLILYRQDSEVIGESMLWIGKIQTINMKFVRSCRLMTGAESSKRIRENQLQGMLKRKFE